MRQESIGIVEPSPITVPVERSWKIIASLECERRQRRDNERADEWGRGHRKDAHYIGMLGEFAVSSYMDKPIDGSQTYDGGKDFTLYGIRIDVKTTVSLDTPAIRDCELIRHKADLFVFCHYDKKPLESITMFGYATRGTWRPGWKRPIIDLRSGPNNSQIDHRELSDMRHLKTRSTPKTVVRYPGGKTNLMDSVFSLSGFAGALFAPKKYIEPFVGGGSMLIYFLKRLEQYDRNIWINDLDASLIALYQTIQKQPDQLIKKVMDITPTVDLWEECKEMDRGCIGIEGAWRKLVLHYCSHGGFGYMAGSAQGGRLQSSKYPIGCRWNPVRIASMISWLSPRLKDAKITNQSVFDMEWDEDAFVLLDPPYVDAGQELYRNSFDINDHEMLSAKLMDYGGKWVLTYDDDDAGLVRSLYRGCRIDFHEMKGGNNHRRKHGEIVISSPTT